MSTASIALLGQPNSGKSTLFNALTGLHQHVGNWPGKTVEKKEGSFSYKGMECAIADLPGSYSLTANSDEELITRDYIASGKADVVCILADSSQLQRSLFMTADYAGIDVPSFLVLNMADVAADQGKTINVKEIEKKLGIPVVLFSATEGKKYEPYYEVMERAVKEKSKINVAALEAEYEKIEGYSLLKELIPDNLINGFTPMWLAVKALEGDKQVLSMLKERMTTENYKNVVNICNNSQGAIATGSSKFSWIDGILEGSVTSKKESIALSKLDKIYLSRVWGKPAVILTVLLGLIGSFIPALPFMGIGQAIGGLKAPVAAVLTSVGAPEILIQIICTVIIQSFCYIVQMLGFVFGVTLVFGLLEEVGVMARISYVFDNTMGKLGLQGKSVMPFLVSFGCTMGGAAGARVIDNWGQKVLTIALAWAVPCGAAWAVIPMLSAIFFGPWAVLVIVVILLTMILHMWVTAKIFGRKLVQKADRYGMIMELPPYHKPRIGALLRYVLGRTGDTFKRVTSVVLLVCGVFWLLSYTFVPGTQPILYRIGTAIEPVTKIFGLGWQLFVAFIASAVGKEGAIGVISALYTGGNLSTAFNDAMSGAGAASNLQEILLANVSKAEALAFIFAMTFNMPCVVALAATFQETYSVKWTAKIALYYTFTALLLACVAYHVGLLIF
ncbi:ferrous iron transport protein B [Butyrivibrio proteoclasticus]|uniref:ferrous iron transport protein B n=1 Tax=Butyrivibrio proteoclasticus TaxID=43305 RepID=UPI00047D4186|nr:ferrous iron transport protein B [Butyrivibrio proteoclasticus]